MESKEHKMWRLLLIGSLVIGTLICITKLFPETILRNELLVVEGIVWVCWFIATPSEIYGWLRLPI